MQNPFKQEKEICMQFDVQQLLTEVLSPLYGERETGFIVRYLLPELQHIKSDELSAVLERLAGHEPWQYIIGKEWFYDLEFKVTPDTLIPRPETEELIYHILQEHSGDKTELLDIGTGTGCIPIALKESKPEWNVSACDISLPALEVAKYNARENNTRIVFFQEDILNPTESDRKWDIIVSNPPYIPVKEKTLMSDNVLKYEPHLALFVPDEDPLLFYRKIGEYASRHLNSGGKLYFELNEFYAEATKELISSMGFKDVDVLNDLTGKPRILSATIDK